MVDGSKIMESMLNKLKSTVTKVTADMTSAVMGNPVTREFEVGRHIASGGPGMSWRIYNGTKKSTKQEVAVFVFDKKIIDRYQKFEKDQIIDSLKKGVQQLTRLRHPRLLTVQHPLEESRDCLAFCTEPVFASLANVLGQWDNLPTPVPTDIKEYKLYDVETKYGLLQPKYVCKEWDPNLPPLCLPNPEYVAPEYILSVSCDASSDMYSLGVLIHAVFNDGKPVFQVNKQDIFKSFSRQLDQLSHLSPGVLSKIPEEVREHVKMLLNVTSNVRPDADQMTKIPFFDDVGAMTLQYFDSLFQRDNLQKSQFYKGLPKRVIVYRILPALTSEFVNPDMVPFVLPNVLLIAEECTKEEYVRLVLPDLTPVFKQQEPVQASNMILLIFLQKMDLLLTKTPPEDIKNSVLPMVYRAVEAPSIQIQELCLNIIPTFANLIEYPSMKNALIPRIKSACLQTSSLAVRVNSLVCLGKILEYLDKWFVIDEILPFLQQIPSREPAVLMGILGIYKCTFTHKKLGIPKEHLASKSLPHLVSLSIDNNLNLNQFNSFMAVIKEMLNRMEAEHKTKLEQLHIMQEQQRSLNITSQMNQLDETKNTPSPATQVRDIDEIFGGSSGSAGVNGKENGSSSTVSQPSRVSLTLEEKQRLAKEQEQAAKLRSQQPLAPQSVKPAATTPQAKDLTSSLLNNMTSLNNLSLNSGTRTMPMQGSTISSTFPAGPTMGGMGTMSVSNGFNSPMGFQTGGMGMGMRPAAPGPYGGMATTTSTPNFGALAQNQNQSSKPPDMSALDSLFASSKPKVSMNQMAPKPAPVAAAPSPWLSQFGTGQPSQTAPIQATPMGMTGVQGGFGMQANPFFNPQNFSQPVASSTANAGMMKQSASVNNDLKDLFG
ncbi:SCY1 2 isoform X1 [Labeo rohita]|uniref:SCY1 2 isoform X1 n=1 Tax=Labeo rohita TaxID=84645 RepID=A0A498L9W6_LABRO|nr:SCY1 2 isoform X1 [Labeo rohita]